MVRDAEGQPVGRIQELCAEFEPHDAGNDYVVREFHVGAYGMFESLAGSRFARQVTRMPGIAGRQYTIPWELMDRRDPDRPRVVVPAAQLRDARSRQATAFTST